MKKAAFAWISGGMAIVGLVAWKGALAENGVELPPPGAPTGQPPGTAAIPPPGTPPPDYSAPPPPDYSAPPPPDYSAPPQEPPPYYAPLPRHHRYYGGNMDTTTSLGDFRFAGLGAFQSGVSVYSLMLSWNPQMTFQGGQYVGANLGGTVLTNALGQNTLALEYQVTVGLPISGPFGVEFGLGAQSWFTNGETAPLLSGNLFYRFPGGVFERVFVGYSAYFQDYFYTSEVKAGVGFAF